MSYWHAVLTEVLNKQDPHQPIFLTNIKKYPLLQEGCTSSASGNIGEPAAEYFYHRAAKKHTQVPGEVKKYWLGEEFPDIYFTKREAQIMRYLLSGLSSSQIAKLLELSRRTIEFYINNMKIKLSCRFRSDLVSKVSMSDFSKGVDFELRMLSKKN